MRREPDAEETPRTKCDYLPPAHERRLSRIATRDPNWRSQRTEVRQWSIASDGSVFTPSAR